MSPPPPQSPRACIVIPTYNEADNITALLEAIRGLGDAASIRVVVIDDASEDGTGERVWAAAERLGGIELISRPSKLGLGTAYLAGFRRAYAMDVDYVVTMDADFSHAPRKIPELLEAMERRNADVAIGSRYVPGGATEHWGLHRKVLSSTANWLAHQLLKLQARDCTSGFRCYRVSYLRDLDLDGIKTDGYSVLVELLFLCEGGGANVVEVPITFRNRERGKSKISRAEIFKAIGTIRRLMRLRRTRTP